MSSHPDFTQWQDVLELVKKNINQYEDIDILTMLMSADERQTLISRVNIFNELLKGELSQRQISQMLGVGIATITRGSNELKSCTDEQKKQLRALLSE